MKSRHSRPAPSRKRMSPADARMTTTLTLGTSLTGTFEEPVKQVLLGEVSVSMPPSFGLKASQSNRSAPQTSSPPGWLVLLLAVSCGLTVANLYYAQPLLAVLRQSLGVSAVTAGGLITATQ